MQNPATLELNGRIDNATSADVEAQINALLDAMPRALIVDMTSVNFVSSLGLRVLLTMAKRCRRENVKVALHSVTSQVTSVLQLSGLVAVLPLHPNRDSALSSVA